MSPPSLDALAVARLEEGRQALGTAEVAAEALPLAGGFCAFGGVGSWHNQAVGLGLRGPVQEADLDLLHEFYVSRGVEPRVEVAPVAHPSLWEGLGRRGYTVCAFKDVFARPLEPTATAAGLMPQAWPNGVQIRPLDKANPQDLETFLQTVSPNFAGSAKGLNPAQRAGALATLTHPHTWPILAHVDGRPAGGGNMELRGAGAGLFGAAVLPWARRRGVQQALMATRMAHAATQGASMVCIQSTPGIPTGRNAQRLGFVLAYTKVVLVHSAPGLAPST